MHILYPTPHRPTHGVACFFNPSTMKNKNRGWQRIILLILPYFLIVGLFQIIGFIIAGLGFFYRLRMIPQKVNSGTK
jgi:hypothetical protein